VPGGFGLAYSGPRGGAEVAPGTRTVSDMTSALERFASENYVSLTTYRRDGTGVPTAVWCAVDGDALYIWTATDTWKVKRIRRRAEVTVAACSRLGKVRSEPIPGRAEICDAAGSERTRELIKAKYGWFGRLSIGLSIWRRGGDGSVGLRVTFPAV
jgi:PPOX class probable F420-dependent enzyme